MPITVTARHMDASTEIQEYARTRVEPLVEAFPRTEHIHVILSKEKHREIAEVVLQAKNHIRVEARETSGNLRASIDLAVEKVEKQMRKLRDKVQSHRTKRSESD